MSLRRRHVGRIKVAFSEIEALAANEIAGDSLANAIGGDWTLTKHSALYRCKDGTYTLNLVWHGSGGFTLTSTTRGLLLGDA
jgi:hypothetical protein